MTGCMGVGGAPTAPPCIGRDADAYAARAAGLGACRCCDATRCAPCAVWHVLILDLSRADDNFHVVAFALFHRKMTVTRPVCNFWERAY